MSHAVVIGGGICGLAAGSSLAAHGEQVELKSGVIGAGYWGPNLVRNISEAPGADIVAVADLDPERLNALHKRLLREPVAP